MAQKKDIDEIPSLTNPSRMHKFISKACMLGMGKFTLKRNVKIKCFEDLRKVVDRNDDYRDAQSVFKFFIIKYLEMGNDMDLLTSQLRKKDIEYILRHYFFSLKMAVDKKQKMETLTPMVSRVIGFHDPLAKVVKVSGSSAKPPAKAKLLIYWVLPRKDWDEVLGDLEEKYYRVLELSNARAARWWFWQHAIRSSGYFLIQRIATALRVVLKIVTKIG